MSGGWAADMLVTWSWDVRVRRLGWPDERRRYGTQVFRPDLAVVSVIRTPGTSPRVTDVKIVGSLVLKSGEVSDKVTADERWGSYDLSEGSAPEWVRSLAAEVLEAVRAEADR